MSASNLSTLKAVKSTKVFQHVTSARRATHSTRTKNALTLQLSPVPSHTSRAVSDKPHRSVTFALKDFIKKTTNVFWVLEIVLPIIKMVNVLNASKITH